MSDAAPENLLRAFEKWLEAQKQAAELMVSASHPGTPQDWAEGYRWVTRISSLALDWIIEKEDPLRPVLFRCQDEYRKLIGDNPDVDYYFASLDASESYRLSGTRGQAPYVGLTVGTDIFRGAQGAMGTLAQHHLDEFVLAEDGEVEIFLVPESEGVGSPGENRILLKEGATQLAVRETFGDRHREEPANLSIERMGEPLPPPRILPTPLAEKLEVAAGFLLFVVRTCVAMYAGSAAQLNQLGGAAGRDHVEAQDDEVRTHSDADMVYIGGRWRIAPGEGLRIRIRPPEGDFRYWGFVILNPWLESYDCRHVAAATNHALASQEADGSWHLLVADEDPGTPNWINTNGRHEGFMLLRWVHVSGHLPAVECEIVELSSLKSG